MSQFPTPNSTSADHPQPASRVVTTSIDQHYFHYSNTGAPPLVLVPGIVSPAALWCHIGERLARDYDCYLLDVRGRGLSEQGSHLDYGLDACANDLMAFLQVLNLARPTIVGHSMGARIGLRVARRTDAPAIEHLVLLDPPASGPGRRPYPVPAERSRKMLDAAHKGQAEVYLRAPGIALWPEPLLKQRAEWLPTCDPRVIDDAYHDFHSQDPYHDLHLTTCPVSLLVAGGSGVIRPGDIADFQAANPSLRVLTLEGAAHQYQAENTEAFWESLCKLLAIDVAPSPPILHSEKMP